MVKTWEELIILEQKKPYWQKLAAFVQAEEKEHLVFPPRSYRFRALELTPLAEVKVVILGQDPYPGYGQANGLAFSVNKGVAIPKSLHNIYQEMIDDVKIPVPHHGDLSCLARQGVLLLNTILTVREGEPLSHAEFGWEYFTDEVIKAINEINRPLVFMLWGNKAIAKRHLLTNPHHLILTAPHPSPLSAYRGFLGCKHFSQANAFLKDQKIDWTIH